MSVDVANETQWRIEPKQFSDLGAWVLDQMRVSPDAELSLTFINPEAIAALHERWMGLKGPTDVMSFPMDQLRPGDAGHVSPAGILGDIVICPDVAARQAQAAGHSVIEEMILLTCHGILHLLGFDHSTHDEEKRMFALQRTLMLIFLAHREGGLDEVVLPVRATDMLALYEKKHPETLAVGHETIRADRVHAPQRREVTGHATSPETIISAGSQKTGSTKPADKPHKPQQSQQPPTENADGRDSLGNVDHTADRNVDHTDDSQSNQRANQCDEAKTDQRSNEKTNDNADNNVDDPDHTDRPSNSDPSRKDNQ